MTVYALQTWYDSIRNKIGKLTETKSGQATPQHTDHDKFTVLNFRFPSDHIMRQPSRVADSVSTILQNAMMVMQMTFTTMEFISNLFNMFVKHILNMSCMSLWTCYIIFLLDFVFAVEGKDNRHSAPRASWLRLCDWHPASWPPGWEPTTWHSSTDSARYRSKDCTTLERGHRARVRPNKTQRRCSRLFAINRLTTRGYRARSVASWTLSATLRHSRWWWAW